MKVMTFVGTRPEIIKLSRVLPALDANFEHALVHTGQNWDARLGNIFFDELKLRERDLQYYLDKDSNATRDTGEIVVLAALTLRRHQPDAVLILGDTNSALAAAYAAKRAKVPLFHMEAGNRCWDDRTPEEINRRMIDVIADVNLPYTEHAQRNLLAMGCRPERIIKTGSPMAEVISHYNHLIDAERGRPPLSYYVVSCHREENVDDPKRVGALVETINGLSKLGTVVVSVHPRLASRLYKYVWLPNVQLHQPFGFIEYARLQRDAWCVISDSGTLAEEAALLKFPAVSIRYATERPEAFEDANFILCDLQKDKVLEAVKTAVAFGKIHRGTPVDYQDQNVSVKVVQAIQSLTDKVRRDTWRQ